VTLGAEASGILRARSHLAPSWAWLRGSRVLCSEIQFMSRFPFFRRASGKRDATGGGVVLYTQCAGTCALMSLDTAHVELLPCADAATFDDWLRSSEVHVASECVFEFRELSGVRLNACVLFDEQQEYRVLTVNRSGNKVGFIRSRCLPPFNEEDASRLLQFANVVAVLLSLRDPSPDRGYEAAALRAVGSGPGSLYVIDVDRGEVVWSDDDARSVQFVLELVFETRQLLAAHQHMPPRALPTIENALLVRVATIDDAICRGAKLAACRVQTIGDANHPIGTLSQRERHIAQLLVDGYSAVNVASIAGIAENTVRTYIKRIYRKFGINSRLELVQLMDTARSLATDERARQRRDSGIMRTLDARVIGRQQSR